MLAKPTKVSWKDCESTRHPQDECPIRGRNQTNLTKNLFSRDLLYVCPILCGFADIHEVSPYDVCPILCGFADIHEVSPYDVCPILCGFADIHNGLATRFARRRSIVL